SRDDTEGASRYAQQALEYLPADAPLRGVVTLNVGWGYWTAGDFEAATQSIVDAIEQSRTSGNTFGAIVAMSHLAHMRVLQGKLRQAEAIYRDSVALVGQSDDPQPAVGIAYVGLGLLCQERNDLDAASKFLSQGLKLCEGLGTAEITLKGLATL